MRKKDADAPSDFRIYINPQPGKRARFDAAWQRAYMPSGPGVEEYVEDKKGKVFDDLLRTVRPAQPATEQTADKPASPAQPRTVVVVRRLFCLAPWAGTPLTRKNIAAKRVDAIKAAGGAVMEAETGRRTDEGDVCAQMIMGISHDIASAGRAGSPRKRGDPVELSPEQEERARLIWRSREHKNDASRLAAIEAAIGRKLKRSWCWQKFGSPSGQPSA